MNLVDKKSLELEKLPTGIDGLDQICQGGLPKGRSTLISGTAGSGKTVLAAQFLKAGLENWGEKGVLVSFEERPQDMIRNVTAFGWNFQENVEAGDIAIIDATPVAGEVIVEAGRYDLAALMARIEYVVGKSGATRVAIDAISALFPQFSDHQVVRQELQRVVTGLRELGVTTIITMEREAEDGQVARFGVEEFVTDNVLLLRHRLESEKRRRTVEVLKFRGTAHHKGEFPFTIDEQEGITIIPLSAMELTQRSSEMRISSGVRELDVMYGGGMFRDSIVLVSGATGTGKTLMVTEFMKAAFEKGERCLLFAFEESRDQLIRNARSWGVDFEDAEQKGALRLVCSYPESKGLEDHLIHIKREIDSFKPTRMAVDSLSALERVSTLKSFREFVIGITSFVKMQEMAGMFTNTTAMLMGGESVTETHISTITDSIILLRYVELHGEMHRGITVLKMRGSWHDKYIREYMVTEEGMQIKDAFQGVSGILAGNPVYSYRDESSQLKQMFDDGEAG